jgi:hypothetical protein
MFSQLLIQHERPPLSHLPDYLDENPHSTHFNPKLPDKIPHKRVDSIEKRLLVSPC